MASVAWLTDVRRLLERHLCRAFETMSLRTIDADDVAEWYATMDKTADAARSRRQSAAHHSG